MDTGILEWLGGDDTGMSSKTIALAALGAPPKRISYPSDGGDFGRCYRLLKLYPEARKGLEYLGEHGGDVWKALVPRWAEIERAYLHDEELYRCGAKKGFLCYDLMKSIINPIEDASGRVIRLGKNISVHTP